MIRITKQTLPSKSKDSIWIIQPNHTKTKDVQEESLEYQ